MRNVAVNDVEARLRLDASTEGLALRAPDVSSKALLSHGQRVSLLAALLLLVVCAALSLVDTAVALIAILTLTYLVTTAYRVVLFVRSTRSDVTERVTDREAREVPDEELPIYTVLVPAYHEPEVIGHLVAQIGQFEYPPSRLDVKLLLEADDEATIQAVKESGCGDQFEIVLVPAAEPRTKPKALNYGLSLARGELVTIFDAEDEPDPLQLRKAAVALARLGPDVACVQAKLSYGNPSQNLITKWFMIEYAMWFTLLLPGLASLRAPIPLGGTSNHFRRWALELMGAWDPYNVTEDADLGLRMFREGYQVRILDSVTYEEANSDFVNWIRQRSRWYKGYLQTLLVHMRRPRELYTEIGWKGVFQAVTFIGGTPVLALLNPVFWLLTVLWFIGHPSFVEAIFPGPVYYVGLVCWAFGNFVVWYMTVVCCRLMDKSNLLWAALLVPLYWVMMSMAGIKAFLQLVMTPSLWEKTTHGLNRRELDGLGNGERLALTLDSSAPQ
ncbi:MAG: glycosyltransferase [Acidimicrobiales bacterium]